MGNNLGVQRAFRFFRQAYSDFSVIDEWLGLNKVFLLIDELNVILPEKIECTDMSHMLDSLAGREGSALMYSTHHRGYADILRGRNENLHYQLSRRPHIFVPIPRVKNKACLEGLLRNPTHDPSLWSAALRARIPCLILQSYERIVDFADISFRDLVLRDMEETTGDNVNLPVELLEERVLERRIQSLARAVTGQVCNFERHTRDEFKAYSYMTDRKDSTDQHLYAWPPFLLASQSVLGKDYRLLRETLFRPQIDEAKAFEALVELAVLLRLLSSQPHELVPDLNLQPRDAFDATEMYHVSDEAKDLDGLITKVSERFALLPNVRQVVVVPLFASFPIYDFFLFHRNGGEWAPTAGYQCKLGEELPDHQHKAMERVGLSVWIGGSCRKYRVVAGPRASRVYRHGWVPMDAEKQFDMLGVSISEALPHQAACCSSDPPCKECDAEMSLQDRCDAIREKRQRAK